MRKVDLKKEREHLYKPSIKKIEIVDVPKMNFLMIDGQGDPNKTREFQEAVEALFSLSYTAKFMVKKGEQAVDYSVMPLEGLWWTDDMAAFSTERKGEWKWTVMIMQPEYVTEELLEKAIDRVKKKKKLAALSKLRFESYHEGPAAQIMHIGPFSEEGPTIEKIHRFINENGYELAGRHHEIYLSDFRKAAPKKLKTVIRQPFQKVF